MFWNLLQEITVVAASATVLPVLAVAEFLSNPSYVARAPEVCSKQLDALSIIASQDPVDDNPEDLLEPVPGSADRGKRPKRGLRGKAVAVAEFLSNPSYVARAPEVCSEQLNALSIIASQDPVEDNPEDLLEPVPGSADRGKRPKRRLRGRFTHLAATVAKVHFGGSIKYTERNKFAVSKFIANYCKEQGVCHAHIYKICCEASVLVFTPDHTEIQSIRLANSPEFCQRRAAMLEVSRIGG